MSTTPRWAGSEPCPGCSAARGHRHTPSCRVLNGEQLPYMMSIRGAGERIAREIDVEVLNAYRQQVWDALNEDAAHAKELQAQRGRAGYYDRDGYPYPPYIVGEMEDERGRGSWSLSPR
jgi:hypothetical protein